MTETATALWFHVAAPSADGNIHSEGRDCKFESVENAVRFVMEELSEADRATAVIQTDSGAIPLADIEKMYRTSSGPEHENRGD
jgi:hypothetical protein